MSRVHSRSERKTPLGDISHGSLTSRSSASHTVQVQSETAYFYTFRHVIYLDVCLVIENYTLYIILNIYSAGLDKSGCLVNFKTHSWLRFPMLFLSFSFSL